MNDKDKEELDKYNKMYPISVYSLSDTMLHMVKTVIPAKDKKVKEIINDIQGILDIYRILIISVYDRIDDSDGCLKFV